MFLSDAISSVGALSKIRSEGPPRFPGAAFKTVCSQGLYPLYPLSGFSRWGGVLNFLRPGRARVAFVSKKLSIFLALGLGTGVFVQKKAAGYAAWGLLFWESAAYGLSSDAEALGLGYLLWNLLAWGGHMLSKARSS